MAGPRRFQGKITRRAVTTMGSNDLIVGEDMDRVISGITGKRTGEAGQP